MASINSLPDAFKGAKLRIIEADSSEEVGIYPLYEARELPLGLLGPEPGPVKESLNYRLELITLSPIDGVEVEICVNGSDPIMADILPYFLANSDADKDKDKGSEHVFRAKIVTKENSVSRPLFFLTYGFARVQISFFINGEEFCLSTKDILSTGSESYQDDLIDQMLNDLLNSSKTTVMDWMLTGEDGRAKRYSSIESALVSGPNISLLAYLQRVEEVVSFFRTNRNFFRYHGHVKVAKTKHRLSFRDIRQISRAELFWISKNMNVLSKTNVKTSILHGDDYYIPQYLESRKIEKSYNGYENRALMGFLDEVVASARRVKASLRELSDDEQKSLSSIYEVLKSSGCEQQKCSASIQLIRTFCNREKRLLERLSGLIDELENERRLYSEFFVGVTPHIEKPLRRTKIFQEIEAYSVSYFLMERWYAGGDYALGRESFALQIYRLDELYEYYVLYRLLCWFHDEGFKEDKTLDAPISHIKYSTGSNNASRCNIANLYTLRKGDTRIRLLYEPCISGETEEEHGIPLHRLSTPDSFSTKKRNRPRPCKWTPDYLLEVRNISDKARYYIFDAKFRKPRDVYAGFPNDCEFSRCLFKYKLDVAGEAPDARVSSVWLLCGRHNNFYFRQMEQSQWALQADCVGSGIGVVTPFFNCLNELLPSLLMKDADSGNSKKRIHNERSSHISNTGSSIASGSNASEAQIEAYVSDLYRVYYDREKLFTAAWSQRHLGINHPLLRRADPCGREGRKYRKIEIDGANVYVYVDMMPQNKEKLIRLSRKSRNT